MAEEPKLSRTSAVPVDLRRVRGDRSRALIARRGADIASLEGLTGLSLGRLAGETGMSKSGIQRLFVSKEDLQVAVVEAARDVFVAEVVTPALAAPLGVARLRALFERWVVFVWTPTFPGGCFRVANLAEFDGRPGPVRDVLFRDQADWRALLAAQLGAAVAAGEIRALDPDLTAFQIDAVLCAVNSAVQFGDATAIDSARAVLEGFLTPPGG